MSAGSAPGLPSGDRSGPPSRRSRRVATLPIRLYQRTISPLLGARCRYYPSCSEYARLSIERFGILRGIVLASWRLLRCNPLSRGGFDYPEDQRLFHHRPPAANAP